MKKLIKLVSLVIVFVYIFEDVFASIEKEENAMVDYLTKNNYLHGKAEIVFLLDRSGSIGAANFEAEKGFVESFLTHVVVDANATRVAVISYSDTAERHIDYLKEPKSKCFLSQELQDVIYRDSGATNIAAAFEEASLVLLNARPNVNKVLILISDGYHTKGADPVPYAARLKASGVQIFCFGVGRFRLTELQKLASSIQHLYNSAGFKEFKRLARKIRGDQHENSWSNQDSKRNCDHLCDSPYKGEPEDPGCCDHAARCSCALLSGTHTCVCGPGYYGLSGLSGRCKACPRGTYKSKLEPVQHCMPCPKGSTTAEVASTSINDCYCEDGYHGNPSKGISCALVKCPPLQKPTNGDLLGNCPNTYGSSCHFICDDGYELVDPSSDIRTCQYNGQWTGKAPICREIQCFPLFAPTNGRMKCESNHITAGKKCYFNCEVGYIMQGSEVRECLPFKKWSGMYTSCIPIECRIPSYFKNGLHTCSRQQKIFYGEVCAFYCNGGFALRGPMYQMCNENGRITGWQGENIQPFCEDIQPPDIKCPPSLVLKPEKGKREAFADWKIPEPIDNTGFPPKLVTIPHLILPRRWFAIGRHTIVYEAIDVSGLRANCSFTIEVKDEEPPNILLCPSKIEASTADSKTAVEWEEPKFEDNSGNRILLWQNAHSGDEFNVGSHQVTYQAKDGSGNTASCTFKVIVSRTTCPYYPPPVNGAFVCHDWMYGQFCRAYCNERYDFSEKVADWYICNTEAQWVTEPSFMPIPWPDCSRPVFPSKVKQVIKAHQYVGDCNDPAVQKYLEKRLLHYSVLKLQNSKLCSHNAICNIRKVKVSCGKIIEYARQGRRRRDIWNQANNEDLELEFEITIDANQELNDTDSVLQDFLNTIQNLDWSLEDDYETEITTMSSNRPSNSSSHVPNNGSVVLISGDIQLICKPGSILSGNVCVLCPSGTFYDEHLKECLDCPLGQYQENEGQFSCVQCRMGMSTEQIRSKNETDCKGICPPGTFSTSGLQTCMACPVGAYQEFVGQKYCLPCPNGTTTARVRSTDAEECKVACNPGTYSVDGLFPCKLCPKNYYQPLFGATACEECPSDLSTIKEGMKRRSDCTDVDPCSNDTFCLNDSQCERNGRRAVCLCKEGFEGDQCADDKNECNESPCSNDGTCINTVGSFHCQCPDGLSGNFCDVEIDECVISPCSNNGTCLDEMNGYSCLCPVGYEGLNCEIEQEVCFHEIICLNGGQCVFDDGNSSFCMCASGYEGIDCSINIDDCLSITCQNNGSCIDGIASYTCQCTLGYTGIFCENEIDECENNLCQNGATCQDLIGVYECVCLPGWNGTYCENKLNSDFVLTFPDSSATIANMATMTVNSPMSDATVSLWVQTTDIERSGTPFSYAVASTSITDGNSDRIMDNALTISDCSGLQIYVNNQPVMTNLQVADGKWHHLAFSWSSEDSGKWSLYKDGQLQSEGESLRPGEVISAGGTLVIGQEQDEVGGGFSPFETFSGNISRVNVWNSYFSQSNVTRLCKLDEDIPGKIVAWPDFLHNLQGDVHVLKNEKPNYLS